MDEVSGSPIHGTLTARYDDGMHYVIIHEEIQDTGGNRQKIEIGGYYSHAITSVEKDNLIIKNEKIEKILDKCRLKLTNGKTVKLRIRKLTPRECFRLQDVDETNIDKMLEAGISNSQLYKMAGNSITVVVLEKIFDQLFYPKMQEATTKPKQPSAPKPTKKIIELSLFPE